MFHRRKRRCNVEKSEARRATQRTKKNCEGIKDIYMWKKNEKE